MMNLTFSETINVAVNSLGEGLIDRQAAVKMIEDAASNNTGKLTSRMKAAVELLEKNAEEYRRTIAAHPLDEMTLEDAVNLYETKGMLLYCRDGHVVAVFREQKQAEENEPLAVCQ